MAKVQPAWMNWTQYAGLRAAVAGMQMFSVRTNLAYASAAGDWMYRIDKRHRDRARANIQRSLPELPDDRVEQITRGSMQHLLQLAVEVMFTTRLLEMDTWAEHLDLVNLDEGLDLIISDRPVLFVTPHFGNWEVLGYSMALLGADMAAVARPIDNPLVNDWLLGVRQNKGLNILTKWGATDVMVDIMERGGSVGFIGDQNAGDKGMFVPYFNRLASAYKSIGLLAIRFNAPVICGYGRRITNDFNFEIGITDVIRPEDWNAQPDPLYYLTARYSLALERIVRQSPEQYLWIHRRWKSRPKFEREGKPMPASLQRQLEALPWMTDELMAELRKPVPLD
ncbi:MAG: hypothetical protein GC159_00215 [Phycisphaera sp.]|nr:hypothetical protein [Phycisphaera sp.]